MSGTAQRRRNRTLAQSGLSAKRGAAVTLGQTVLAAAPRMKHRVDSAASCGSVVNANRGA